MSPTAAKGLVVFSVLAMLALIGLNTSGKYRSGGSKYKAAWAAGVFGLVLSLVADVAPQVAGPLALLALTAVAFKNPAELGPLFKPAGSPAQTAVHTTLAG